MVAEGATGRRVALLADYLEEGWPSMDLAAEMLAQHLPNAAGSEMESECLRPKFKVRLGRLRVLNRRTLHNADRLLNRFVDYPHFLRRRRGAFDLFHIVDHSYSQLVHELPANRTIVTCHDLDTFRCLWAPNHGGRGPAFLSMTRRILKGLQKAARVLCDSAATGDELVGRNLLPTEKVTVVPLGVHPAFFLAPTAVVETEVDRLLGTNQNQERPIDVLHVGSTIPRKRIHLLLEIFAGLRRTDERMRLLRVGGEFTAEQHMQIARLNLKSSIRTLPFLRPEQLASIYRRAALVLLPSEAEGFGFPILEAMASGTAIVATDLPVLREVGGNIASYVPRDDVNIWVTKVNQVLAEERHHSGESNAKRVGRQTQAAKFTWQRTAVAVTEVYRELLGRNQ